MTKMYQKSMNMAKRRQDIPMVPQAAHRLRGHSHLRAAVLPKQCLGPPSRHGVLFRSLRVGRLHRLGAHPGNYLGHLLDHLLGHLLGHLLHRSSEHFPQQRRSDPCRVPAHGIARSMSLRS